VFLRVTRYFSVVEVAPGIFCKILAADAERDRVTMLVRLLPGVSYPPHTHAGIEELHLLDGDRGPVALSRRL
jgi:hypothetical protein